MKLSILIMCTVFSNSVFAAGFEKSLFWSAKAAAQAGAVVGSVSGADALYFNPAGLAATSGKGELSINFSPTFSKFTGANPYQYSGSTGNTAVGTVDGKTGFSPIGGIIGSYRVNEELGVGAGYYVSGGTKSTYESLNYGSVSVGVPYTLAPKVETDLRVREAAVGAGYEIMPGLRFGAAWRVIMVEASFSTVAAPTGNPHNAISNVTINDIKATRWNGYKLGLQYDQPEKAWGLGVSYRSNVDFTAKSAPTSGFADTAGAADPTALIAGAADLSNSFPQQLNIGGYVRAMEFLKVALEYSYTNYSRNQTLIINGTVNGSALANISQNWRNQHIGRIGFEYTGCGSMPLRIGYAYTSQVTPTEYARSTFASPGPGHGIALGSGIRITDNLDFDFAGEYSFASGSGRNVNAPNPSFPEVTNDSEFTSRAYAAHLSAKYHF